MTDPAAVARLEDLRARTPEMLLALEALVSAESPSDDLSLLETCSALVCELGADATGAEAEIIRVEGHPHLLWAFGGRPRAVLVGHYDTVWPAGTIGRWPFSKTAATATGPGTLDMKAGIVQLFAALASLEELSGISVVLTCDEETGSATSRELVMRTVKGARGALVLEPSADGALKLARKGTANYTLRVYGRAAHAGLEPEKGANALIEAARLVLAVSELGRPDVGTTVTPTVACAGTTTNTVPAEARIEIDVRTALPAEVKRVDAALRALTTTVPGTRLSIGGGPNRPPMPISTSERLFARARAAATRLGLPDLEGVTVGGGSDGNFTAAAGTPTLDGLGGVGAGAHAEGEFVDIEAMPERAALVAELVAELQRGD